MNRAVEAYLGELASSHYSLSRQKQVKRILEMLMLYLREAHRTSDWREVSEGHLRGFAVYAARRRRRAKGGQVSPDTVRQMISIVRSFFRWMRRIGRLVYDPSERLELPAKSQRLPQVLSEQQIARLIEMADTRTAVGIRDRALMETLYATGIRSGEARKLDIYDVDTAAGWLIVRQGKGRKDRIVPLTETASRWLRRYISEARPELVAGKNRGSNRVAKGPTSALWISRRGQRISEVWMAQSIRKYARQANVKASGHTFRHSCATHLLRGGASVRHVQKLLGHASLGTTEIYTHIEIEDLKRAVERATEDERGA